MGMSWSNYMTEYAREAQTAGASGGAGGAQGSSGTSPTAPGAQMPSCTHQGCFPGQYLNKIIVPKMAPFAINTAAPEQNDINNNFSTTQQYGQRFGLARAHF